VVMTAVIDVDAFKKEHFDAAGYRDQALMLLRGMASNGLILLDCEGRLGKGLASTISSLPTKDGQELVIRLEELMKGKRKRMVKCHFDACTCATADLLTLAREVRGICGVDALILSNENAKKLGRRGDLSATDVLLGQYIVSGYEKQRLYFQEGMRALDQLEPQEVDDLIIRITRFAKWLRFYDKQIGTGNNISHFRQGIEYILDLWQRHGHFASRDQVEFVDIITCPAERVRVDESDRVKQNTRLRNEEVLARM
jgi:hypothetical protein